MSLRFEVWTPPTSALFQKVAEDLPVETGSGTVEQSVISEVTIAVPRTVKVNPGFVIPVFLGGWSSPIDEFIAERIQTDAEIEDSPVRQITGPNINGLASKIAVYPADHPASPSVRRDWIWQDQTSGLIVRQLVEAAQARGTALYLELRFTDSADSLGAAWPTTGSIRAAPPQTLDNVLATLAGLGVRWEIHRKVEPDPPLTHDLFLYAPGSRPDKTNGIIQLITPAGGSSIIRSPDATVRLALGDAGVWVEDVDSELVAIYGRQERPYEQPALLTTGALTAFIDEAATSEAFNQRALKAVFYETDQIVPLRHIRPGDLVPWLLAGLAPAEDRPIQSITWTQAEEAVFEVTGSRVYDPETALNQAVTELLDEISLRPRPATFAWSRNIFGATPFGTTITTAQTSTAIADPGVNVDVEAYVMGWVSRPNATACVVGVEIEVSIDGGSTWDSTGQEVLLNADATERVAAHAVHVLINANPTGTIQSRCQVRIVAGDTTARSIAGTLVTRVTPATA